MSNDRALITSFSSTKREILLLLKKEGEQDLTTLSEKLNLSKMGVLNHIKDLEEEGVIERMKKRGGVGRPRLYISLAKDANDIFPRAYASISCSLLRYIDEKMGRPAVYEALKHRQDELKAKYKPQLVGLDLHDRVEQLAKMRDEDGYMVELNMLPGGSFELLEFNCPLLSIAEEYMESCETEHELMEDLLDASVEVTHRAVAGDHVCRFHVKEK